MSAGELAADLSPALLAPRLQTRRLGRALVALDSCASTSDEAAARARRQAPEGLVIVADTQTGGRGRLGRVWFSPPGANLYVSVLLRPPLPAWQVPPLTLLAGAVLADVLAAHGFAPLLKWPNDVLLRTEQGLRKVAGILTEMASEREQVRHVVVGLGLNVNAVEFPDELAARATSLRLVGGRPWDRGALLASFLNAFEPLYDAYLTGGPAVAIERWRPRAQLGQRCRVDQDGTPLEGLAVDLDPQGALLVRDDTGKLHRILSGEVTLTPDLTARPPVPHSGGQPL